MDMAGAGDSYPSVFVVDRTTLPPLPPKPGHTQAKIRRNNLIQNILFLLVFIILLGLAVEGYFIFKLYENHQESQSGVSQPAAQIGVKNKSKFPPTSTKIEWTGEKPVAHLTAVSQGATTAGLMLWNLESDPILHGLKYKEGKLQVQKDGIYFVYSKICFKLNGNFIHLVQKETQRYQNKPIELMLDRRYNMQDLKDSTRSSFLGGVFHLYRNDVVSVHVNMSKFVIRQTSADNYFGMFML